MAAEIQPENGPVTGKQRIVALDLMRGIAVLGILLANITAFAHVDLAYYWPPALPGGANEGDKLVWLAQFVLVDGKFRGLFSILFGAGLALFVERAGRFDRAVWLQARRLFWLALFGLAHFTLLFNGDILFAYATGGLVALLFLLLDGRRLLSIGIAWALLGGGMMVLSYEGIARAELGAGNVPAEAIQYYKDFWDNRLAMAALQEQLVSTGSYWDILRYRVLGESAGLGSQFTTNLYETVPLMLMGMGFYRLGLFRPAPETPHWQGLALAAVALGLAGNLATGLFVYWHDFPPFTTQLGFFGFSLLFNVPMLAGGIPLLARWAGRSREGWLQRRLAAAGRMAFSNYVGTSLVMMLVFHGWAGGLFGTLHRVELFPVVLLGWALMLLWSQPWLARFRHGPLEYLWRCLTYWRAFPFLRREGG